MQKSKPDAWDLRQSSKGLEGISMYEEYVKW